MKTRPLTSIACAASIAALAACSSTPMRGDAYQSSAPVYGQQAPAYSQSGQYAEFGTVRGIDVIPTQARTSGGGAVLGAVLGAVVGNQIGSGSGRAAATVAGAVGGGVAGNAIEKRTRRDDEVFRVSVRFDDGSYREFDFQRVDDLRVGDRVKWEGGQLLRL
jgi:outer membrane lipoprotein SlyB